MSLHHFYSGAMCERAVDYYWIIWLLISPSKCSKSFWSFHYSAHYFLFHCWVSSERGKSFEGFPSDHWDHREFHPIQSNPKDFYNLCPRRSWFQMSRETFTGVSSLWDYGRLFLQDGASKSTSYSATETLLQHVLRLHEVFTDIASGRGGTVITKLWLEFQTVCPNGSNSCSRDSWRS